VLDFNGTLAADGMLLPGVKDQLERLSGVLRLHVLTADTFGSAGSALAAVPRGDQRVWRGTASCLRRGKSRFR